ncbi:MAG: MmcQ/YjbR family DNA-binding protein [Chitinophagaceae bacterium]
MNIEDLQQFCLSLPEVEETLPFGPDTLVFKVQGKVFLLAGLDQSPVSFNVKCDPEKAIELREAYPAVQPGYHMNKKHWNTVTADGSISTSLLKEWIRESYELVKPRAKKKKQ